MIAGSNAAVLGNSITLRPITTDDEPFLLELYAGTRLTELELIPWDENQKRAFIRMQFDARQKQYGETYPSAESSMILQRGEPIGTLVVARRDREIVLVDIALLPQHRNAGIGTHLVKALLEEATVAGKTVRLRVLAGNPAVRMYERVGFRKTNDNGAYLEMNWPG